MRTQAPTVQLSLGERTINKLMYAERKRSGSLLERHKEEFAILNAAFDEVRAEERDACAHLADIDGHAVAQCIAAAIRARGGQ